MASDLFRIALLASAAGRDFLAQTHRALAARWPHGQVQGAPAAVGQELATISKWMRITWPMTGGVPMSDQSFREVLKTPFTYHRSYGTQAGLLAAVAALGYQGARYMDYTELRSPPTWTPPGGGGPVVNQNAFGLICSTFPTNWIQTDGTPTLGTPLDSLVKTVMKFKRASARFWEIRSGENIVVTQSWWDAGQNPSTLNEVRTQSSSDADPDLVTTTL